MVGSAGFGVGPVSPVKDTQPTGPGPGRMGRE